MFAAKRSRAPAAPHGLCGYWHFHNLVHHSVLSASQQNAFSSPNGPDLSLVRTLANGTSWNTAVHSTNPRDFRIRSVQSYLPWLSYVESACFFSLEVTKRKSSLFRGSCSPTAFAYPDSVATYLIHTEPADAQKPKQFAPSKCGCISFASGLREIKSIL